MKSLDLTVEEFKAKRRKQQDELVARLLPKVKSGLKAQSFNTLISLFRKLYSEVYRDETVQPMRRAPLNALEETVRENLAKTTKDSSPEAVALMLALAVLNGVSEHAAREKSGDIWLVWTTMHDNRVREAHVAADGQTRPPGETFDVGGHQMRFPGDPSAPVELWINCRCVLRPTRVNQSASDVPYPEPNEGVQMTTTETEPVVEEETVTSRPWYGVLAPEGVFSGDGRRFAEGSLTHRDLPLPLTWQKVSAEGHDQNVTVAKIEQIEMIDGLMHGYGHYLNIPEADEVYNLIEEFGKFGVSVDADDAQFEFDEESGEVTFTSARVCSACIVAIPAFAEAYVANGEHPTMGLPVEEEAVAAAGIGLPTMTWTTTNGVVLTANGTTTLREVSEEERDRRADDGTAMPDGSYPIANCSDLKNAIQAIGRAKDPEATKRHIKKRYRALNCDLELPEDWAMEPAQIKDLQEGDLGEAINIVAAGGWCAPSEWFKDPELTQPTGIVIEESGRTYGHIAEWGVCHIGIGNDCTTAPPSSSGYGYFLTGEVITDDGPVPVGNLTVDTGHAPGKLGAHAAAAHYDNTGSVWADVTVGEDEFGIWFAGMVRPGTTEETLYAVRASGRLSGDWRKVHGDWEMVGALSVNVPGFPVTAPQVTIAAGAQVSLVAAGIVNPHDDARRDISAAEIAAALADELEARAKRKARLAALKEKHTVKEDA